MTVKADLTGGEDPAPRRTYKMGDERCPSCGQKSCDGTCDEDFYKGTGVVPFLTDSGQAIVEDQDDRRRM